MLWEKPYQQNGGKLWKKFEISLIWCDPTTLTHRNSRCESSAPEAILFSKNPVAARNHGSGHQETEFRSVAMIMLIMYIVMAVSYVQYGCHALNNSPVSYFAAICSFTLRTTHLEKKNVRLRFKKIHYRQVPPNLEKKLNRTTLFPHPQTPFLHQPLRFFPTSRASAGVRSGLRSSTNCKTSFPP